MCLSPDWSVNDPVCRSLIEILGGNLRLPFALLAAYQSGICYLIRLFALSAMARIFRATAITRKWLIGRYLIRLKCCWKQSCSLGSHLGAIIKAWFLNSSQSEFSAWSRSRGRYVPSRMVQTLLLASHGRIPHCGNRPTSTLICSYMNNISILLRKGSSPKMDECLE